MELESVKAIEALKNYKAKDLAEELVVELLLTPSSDRDGLAAMADKIVDSDLSDVEVENLHLVVGRIRREVGIDQKVEDQEVEDQEVEDQEVAKLDFSRMKEHLNHSIVCVEYGDFKSYDYSPPFDVAFECETCNEVLHSWDFLSCMTTNEEKQFFEMMDHVGHQLGIRVRCGAVPGQPMYAEIYCKQCGDVTLFTSEGAVDEDYGIVTEDILMNEHDSIALEVIDEEIKILEQRIADRENRFDAIRDKSNELFAQAKKISDDYFAANAMNSLQDFWATKEGESCRALYHQVGPLDEEEGDLRDEDSYDQNQLIVLRTIYWKIMNKIKEKNK